MTQGGIGLVASAFALVQPHALGQTPGASTAREIDAVTFAVAFKDGAADKYLGYTVRGSANADD